MAKRKKGPTAANPPAPRIAELMRVGWSRRDAEHLGVVGLALSLATELDPAATGVLATHACSALQWEPVLCGAQILYGEAEHAPAWRALAAAVEGPMRDVLLRLAAAADGADVESRDLCDVFTAEDLRITEEARQAEARGELGEALRLLKTCTRPLNDGWVTDLERMLRHGDELPPSVWGRWICSAALRWCQTTERGLEMGVHYAEVALRALGCPDEHLSEQAIRRAGYDQLVHDALLWDEGGLSAYLERELAPALRARVPGIGAWPDARLRVLILVEAAGADAVCEDLLTGESVVVGDQGLAGQHPPGRIFVGRVVSIDGNARSFFAVKPTMCEDVAAALSVAELAAAGADADARIDALHRPMRQEAA